MIGIYKFTNLINNKSYIGQSIDIEKRYKEHKRNHLNPNYNNYNSKFYRALRKYGFENFSYEIIIECSQEECLSKEVEYILVYDSYNNGYNSTKGGEDNPSFNQEIVEKRTKQLLENPAINAKLSHKGEENPNALLTEKDVIDIRKRFLNKEDKNSVYEIYKNKIGYSGFDYCWRGKTWSLVMPEVFEERIIENRGGSKLTREDVIDIKTRLKNKENIELIYQDYKNKIGKAGFKKIRLGYTWKDVIV